jgi:hypothetical protein
LPGFASTKVPTISSPEGCLSANDFMGVCIGKVIGSRAFGLVICHRWLLQPGSSVEDPRLLETLLKGLFSLLACPSQCMHWPMQRNHLVVSKGGLILSLC